MSKRQINVTSEEIKRLIKEELDAIGYKRYPEGVFSTDSEEGESFKEYDEPRKGDSLMWDPIERSLKDAKDAVTGEKWADTAESSWDSDKKRDMVAQDKFRDEKAASDMFDKPFGDLDDIENQWDSEPGHEEEEEDDEDIAGLNEGKITLSEEGLRKFVSYSVARLLREGYGPIYRNLGNGEYDYDGDQYGSSNDTTEIELSNEAILYALKEVAGIEFNGQSGSEAEFINEMMKKIGFDDIVKVSLSFDVDEEPGDYWTPGYRDIKINSWEIDSSDRGYAQASDTGKKIMETAAGYEIEGNEDELYNRLNEERNLGVTTHFDGESSFKRENPYEGMTWDEYCEAKRKEREEDQMKSGEKGKDKSINLGVTTHFECPVGKVGLSKDDLAEMVKRTVNEVIDNLGQAHGSLRLDQEGDFAAKIFALMHDMEDEMADIEERKERDGDWDDENTYRYYSSLKRTYNALDDLVHFMNSDY